MMFLNFLRGTAAIASNRRVQLRTSSVRTVYSVACNFIDVTSGHRWSASEPVGSNPLRTSLRWGTLDLDHRCCDTIEPITVPHGILASTTGPFLTLIRVA